MKIRKSLLAVALLTMTFQSVWAQYDYARINNVEFRIDPSIGEAEVYNDYGVEGDYVVPEAITVKGKSYPVTGIYKEAFNRSKITSIDVAQVKRIGDYAFTYCLNLSNITFHCVERIGEYAFIQTPKLTYVDLKNVRRCGAHCFSNSNVEVVDCGSMEEISDHAFEEATHLRRVNFRNVRTIGHAAFSCCSQLDSLDFAQVEHIKDQAFFKNEQLSYVDFANVKTIGTEESNSFNGAFEFCTDLKSLKLTNTELIGESAFANCMNLQKVELGRVKRIGRNAFLQCDGLKLVDLGETMVIGAYAFFDSMRDVSFELDLSNVRFVGDKAFRIAGQITAVYFGKKLEELQGAPFYREHGITKVVCPAVVPPLCEEGVFEKDVFRSAELQVPEGCKAAYESAVGWRNFFNIREVEGLGISSAASEIKVFGSPEGIVMEGVAEGALVSVYDLSGRMCSQQSANGNPLVFPLQCHGLYMVKVGSEFFKIQL